MQLQPVWERPPHSKSSCLRRSFNDSLLYHYVQTTVADMWVATFPGTECYFAKPFPCKESAGIA